MRRVAVLLSLSLFAGLAAGVGSGSVTGAQAESYTSPEAEAVATDKPVEVEDARTESSTLYANPSGTYTREFSAVPIRVRKEDGWVPVDLDLERVDGVVRPKAGPGAVELSGGGSDPLLSVTTAGVETRLTWPDALPEPELEGPSATYRDVFEGVDLVMTATDGGVSQVLVVHDAEAAANPELASLHIGTEVDGGSIESSHGGLKILDDLGRPVGEAAAPTMWDSSGQALSKDGLSLPDASAEAVEQRLDGPAHGDAVTNVDLSVDGDGLELNPERAALTCDDVDYPVFIDPTLTKRSYSWGMVFKELPNSSFYQWRDEEGQAVGHQEYRGVSTKRLFFRFDISSIRGVDVSSANMKDRMTWSSSCEYRATRIYKVGPFNSSLSWNNQPTFYSHLASASERAHDTCNPGGVDVKWGITAGVRESVEDGNNSIALALRAPDEDDQLAWRRFAHTAVLSVTYNRPPSIPTSTRLGRVTRCEGSKYQPKLGRRTTYPLISAILSDPDDDNVRGFIANGGTPANSTARQWDEVTSGAGASGDRNTSSFTNLPRNSAGNIHSGTYWFKFRARDSNMTYGAYGAKCTFTVDAVLAGLPEVISIDAPDLLRTSTGGLVKVGPGEGTDTAKYAWSIDNPARAEATAVTNLAADATASFRIKNLAPGPHVLRVWAFDAANNPSDGSEDVPIYVDEPEKSWSFRFDETSGPSLAADGTAFLAGAAPRANRLKGSASQYDRMLRFDGSAIALPSLAGALIDTNRSFTIAAFLDPADQVEEQVAWSLTGTNGSALELFSRRNSAGNGLEYVARMRDTGSSEWRDVVTPGDQGEVGNELVVFTYDDPAGRLSLVAAGAGDDAISWSTNYFDVTTPTLSAPKWRLGGDAGSARRWVGTIDHFYLSQQPVTDAILEDLLEIGNFNNECVQLEGTCN